MRGKAILQPHLGDQILPAKKHFPPFSWHIYCWRKEPQAISLETICIVTPMPKKYFDQMISNSVFVAEQEITKIENGQKKKLKKRSNR